METKISYCSDVVTKVRKSEDLMEYLVELENFFLTEDEMEEITKEFEKQVSISSQNVPGMGISPLIEKVYLFDNLGNYISTSYYAMTYTEIEKSNQEMEAIYALHQKSASHKRDYGYYSLGDDSLCLVFPFWMREWRRKGVSCMK